MLQNYSTVPGFDSINVFEFNSSHQFSFNKLILSFTLTVNVGGLINKHHCNFKQQHLYSLIKNYEDT